MSYIYRRKLPTEIEEVAEAILKKFPHRRRGNIVDIEGIIEDCGIVVLPRPNIGPNIDAYLAKNPKYIVVRESLYSYLPNARYILSEEICHRILEFDLWKKPKLPQGADCHQLTKKQQKDIEENAAQLAAAVLQPKDAFLERYNFHRVRFLNVSHSPLKVIEATLDSVAEDFKVNFFSCVYRARNVQVITHAEYAAFINAVGL